MSTMPPNATQLNSNKFKDYIDLDTCQGCKKDLYKVALQCGHIMHYSCFYGIGDAGASLLCPFDRAKVTKSYVANYDPEIAEALEKGSMESIEKQLFSINDELLAKRAKLYFTGDLLSALSQAIKFLFPEQPLAQNLPEPLSKDECISTLKQLSLLPAIQTLNQDSSQEDIYNSLNNVFPDHVALACVDAKKDKAFRYLVRTVAYSLLMPGEVLQTQSQLAERFKTPKDLVDVLLVKCSADGDFCAKLRALETNYTAHDLFVPLARKFPAIMGLFIKKGGECPVCLDKLDDTNDKPYLGTFIETSEKKRYHPECFNPSSMKEEVKAGAYFLANHQRWDLDAPPQTPMTRQTPNSSHSFLSTMIKVCAFSVGVIAGAGIVLLLHVANANLLAFAAVSVTIIYIGYRIQQRIRP